MPDGAHRFIALELVLAFIERAHPADQHLGDLPWRVPPIALGIFLPRLQISGHHHELRSVKSPSQLTSASYASILTSISCEGISHCGRWEIMMDGFHIKGARDGHSVGSSRSGWRHLGHLRRVDPAPLGVGQRLPILAGSWAAAGFGHCLLGSRALPRTGQLTRSGARSGR